jgi:hypothetical protein
VAKAIDPWTHVQRRDHGCWYWTGAISRDGYGRWWVRGERRYLIAHRVVYESLVGPIPDGLQLDHDCHNRDPDCRAGFACPHRACVRPDHMVPRTGRENVHHGKTNATKTHCKRKHKFTPENTAMRQGKRFCLECGRIRQRAFVAADPERARQINLRADAKRPRRRHVRADAATG